ncbi:hypothetical protein PR202_ga11554 [Eleusine coracana subsp. coracana]|uniref:Fe2OG dioxygenase domain-containing protein n=1 Tax=Eleusine coracana subsp. coracana TaxID=191504 RepID=A0AAV5C969_ELECO|nr:hypothetical protein PR202_ga11554 [Eleusine coracana subsp. coracana]
MVVLSKGELDQIALPAVQRPAPPLAVVPEVDLDKAAREGANGRAAAARAVAAACEKHGFFKVTGHGVPEAILERMDAAAAAFFALQQREKDAARAFGYSSKRIGCNGDLGWVEYLLLGVTPSGAAPLPESSDASTCSFRDLLNEYIAAVRRMTCTVLELMAEGLGLDETDAFTRLVLDKESDSMLRVNHYPPRPELKQLGGHGRLTGFGEHTDPQIISVLRSNDTSGLEISLRDGSWVSVPADRNSFFVNVGDALQVLTNGRFRSVPHRVMVNSARPRVSVIFFAGPAAAGEAGAPLPGAGR